MQTERIAARMESEESQPLAEIVARLSSDLRLLAREEMELAKREIGEKVAEAKVQAAALALGASAIASGVLVLLAAAVLALATLMPAWIAALLVGAVVTSVGTMLVLSGKAKLSRISVKPVRTLENVRRDVEAIKGAVS